MDHKPERTTADRVQLGVDIFARIETSLRSAADGALELREIFEAAYVAGDLPDGRAAIDAMDQCLIIAGDIGSIKTGVMDLHDLGKQMAEATGEDIAVPYAELAERDESKPRPRSGGGR